MTGCGVRPPWWAPLSAASASIACSGSSHEVRWEQGSLLLPSHGDVEAEQALGALGASPPACVLVRSAWNRATHDPVMVTLGRRPGEAEIGIGPNPGPGGRTALVAKPRRRDALLLVFTLPAPLIDRAVLTAAFAAAERWDDPSFRELHGLRLGAALAARANPGLRRLGQQLARAGEAVVVHCIPISGNEPAAVLANRTMRGLEVTASLPIEWIATVWGAGISEVGGRMVLSLDAANESGDRLSLTTAKWQPRDMNHWEAEPQPATVVRNCDSVWQLVETAP